MIVKALSHEAIFSCNLQRAFNEGEARVNYRLIEIESE